MEGTSLLSLPEGMLIEQIQITENGLVIALVATHPLSGCPLCSEPSSSIHSHYRLPLSRTGGARLPGVLFIRAGWRRLEHSHLAELQSFAAGIEKDKEAVKAGLTWWINNGRVQGHVTKLKLIKRQGYGKAGFPLLRKRVLHAI
jgi:transposase